MNLSNEKKEQISKIEKLLLSFEIESVKQGIQIIETLNDPDIFQFFLQDIDYPDEKTISFQVNHPVWKSLQSDKTYLNTVILGLLNSAPDSLDIPLVQKRPSITRFDFNIVNEIIGELNFPNLKEVILYSTSVQNLDCLNKLRIEHLYINDAPQMESIDSIYQQANLKKIELLGLKEIKTINLSNHLSQLENINIHNCRRLNTLLLEAPQITELNLSGCRQIKELNLKNCSLLKKLILSNCDSLTTIRGLSHKKLEFLSLNRCPELKDLENAIDFSVSFGKVSYCKKLDKGIFANFNFSYAD